jgi:hypothetical protein
MAVTQESNPSTAGKERQKSGASSGICVAGKAEKAQVNT